MENLKSWCPVDAVTTPASQRRRGVSKRWLRVLQRRSQRAGCRGSTCLLGALGNWRPYRDSMVIEEMFGGQH